MMPNFHRTVLFCTWRACSNHKYLPSPLLTEEYSGRRVSRILLDIQVLELTSVLRRTDTSFTFRRTTVATIVAHLCCASLMPRNVWSYLIQSSCRCFAGARFSRRQKEISSIFIV